MQSYTKITIQPHGAKDFIIAIVEASVAGVKISYHVWNTVRGIGSARVRPSDGDTAVRILDAEGKVEYAVLNPKYGAAYLIQAASAARKIFYLPVSAWDVWEVDSDDVWHVQQDVPSFSVPRYDDLNLGPANAGHVLKLCENRPYMDVNPSRFGKLEINNVLYVIDRVYDANWQLI